MLDQPSAENRTKSRGNGCKTGPCADGFSSIAVAERRADDGETSRDQQCGADSLYGSRKDQLIHAQCETASGRSDSKKDDAHYIDSFPAVEIAERSAHKQQSRQEKRIRLDNPLHVDDRGMELSLKRRQSNIDDGAINERKT